MNYNFRFSTWRMFLATFALLFAASLSGCSERNLAPELDYAPEEVEQFRKTIEDMDWD